MQECVKCGSYLTAKYKDVCVGWRMIADKTTCFECGNIEYSNERNEDEMEE